jgi:hypothetical protein
VDDGNSLNLCPCDVNRMDYSPVNEVVNGYKPTLGLRILGLVTKSLFSLWIEDGKLTNVVHPIINHP